MSTSAQSDSSESSSPNMEYGQKTTEESSESSSSKLSETTSSSELPISGKLPSSQLPPSESQEDLPSTRKTTVWQSGQSGNPRGRQKGTKNQITILKESLELKLRNKASYKIEKVLDKAVELALAGDRLMIKLLLELHISKAAHTEDTTGGKTQVAVVIQNLTDQDKRSASTDVIDVTPIKVSKDE